MENILQHFRKDEQPFIEQVLGWQREVEDFYAPKLTDFLDPRQRFIVNAIISHNDDLYIQASGAFTDAERQRVLICPSYYEVQAEDFAIAVYYIKYPTKFLTLQHPDVLGSLLALGVDRSRFGDIRLADGEVQFAVAEEVAGFVEINLTSMAKAKVRAERLAADEPYLISDEVWEEKSLTVSSLRLDVVLASVINVSRQKAQTLIKGGKVKVNFTVREEVAYELEEEDLLSARGFGRMKILAIEGRTRKDKIRLVIGQTVVN